jgi:hypothetical protein
VALLRGCMGTDYLTYRYYLCETIRQRVPLDEIEAETEIEIVSLRRTHQLTSVAFGATAGP